MAEARSGLEITSNVWPLVTVSPSFTLRSMTRPPPREVTWMVRFTSGETTPLAVTSVGRARVSAWAVLNSWGCSVSKTSGSRVMGCVLVAAGVSFEQATPPQRAASTSASGSQCEPGTPVCGSPGRLGDKNFIIGLPRAPRPSSAGLLPSDRTRPDSRNSIHRAVVAFCIQEIQ